MRAIFTILSLFFISAVFAGEKVYTDADLSRYKVQPMIDDESSKKREAEHEKWKKEEAQKETENNLKLKAENLKNQNKTVQINKPEKPYKAYEDFVVPSQPANISPSQNSSSASTSQNQASMKKQQEDIKQQNEIIRQRNESIKQYNESVKQHNEKVKQDIESIRRENESIEATNSQIQNTSKPNVPKTHAPPNIPNNKPINRDWDYKPYLEDKYISSPGGGTKKR